MLYEPELQWPDRLGGCDGSLSGRLVEPAPGNEAHEQRHGQESHPGVHHARLVGGIAVPPDADADQRQQNAGDEQAGHSGRLRRSVNRRTPFLKSSVERASTLVTTPAAIPSSKERESSL